MKYGGHMYGRRTGRREKLWRKEEGNLALRNLQGYIYVVFFNEYTVKCLNKGNNKITELRTILQRESQNS
jgi:hypothetical protein